MNRITQALYTSYTIVVIGEFTMGTVVVTRNYQITLPKDVREDIGIEIGEKMITKVIDEGILIKRLNKSPVDRDLGIWKDKTPGTVFVDKLRKDWRR